MKIYFAGAIMGNSESKDHFFKLMEYLKKYGEIVDEAAGWNGEDITLTPKEVHDRDFKWMQNADVLIAEVTTKSLGVGYEIGRATELKKKILCLYRPQENKKLSLIVAGSGDLTLKEYSTLGEAFRIIDSFLGENN